MVWVLEHLVIGLEIKYETCTQIGEDVFGLSPTTPTTPSTTTSIFQNIFSSIGDFFRRG